MNHSAKTDFTKSEGYTAGTNTTSSIFGRLARFAVIFIIIVLFLTIALSSAPKNQDLSSIRDERTIVGDKKAGTSCPSPGEPYRADVYGIHAALCSGYFYFHHCGGKLAPQRNKNDRR